ncbi:MAG: DUF2892 domain-containing protein [Phycisphaeraceae bacterium]|nr:DUF2892 domain-containing protein [Phycisphaeraceae bacterium]
MALCKNVGSVDRGFRAIVGIAALVLAFTALSVMAGSLWGIVATVVGVIMLMTAAIGTCPLYVPLKVSTCKPASR